MMRGRGLATDVAGLEGAGDVPQCTIPTGDKGGNGGAQPGGKVGSAAPEEGTENGAEAEEPVTARREASEEALEQVLQVCAQDMSVIQGGEEEGAAGGLADKRKRGDELAHQPVRHSP